MLTATFCLAALARAAAFLDGSCELNKVESRNSLARAVFIHRLGGIRDRTYEKQQHRDSGLNLIVTAIILWTPDTSMDR
jgi:TnpA family transposase